MLVRNGRVTALLHSYAHHEANLVGIDLTSAEVAAENLSHLDRAYKSADLRRSI